MLLHFNQSPSFLACFGCGTSICIFGCSNCYVTCSSYNNKCVFTLCISFFLNSIVPISILGAHRFYDTLTNFLRIFGYWASAYVAIIITEHLCFQKGDPSQYYDVTAWNIPQRLPSGIAAVAAGVLSFGMVIPCMSQNWFTDPIARTTGDIEFEVAFMVSGMLYLPFRWLKFDGECLSKINF